MVKTQETNQIKYATAGASDDVQAEQSHRGKKVAYDIEAIATVLKTGKKYVLPSSIQRVNTVYEILQKLKEMKPSINASYGCVKGTVVTHIVKSKNNIEYSYNTAQYFIFVQ